MNCAVATPEESVVTVRALVLFPGFEGLLGSTNVPPVRPVPGPKSTDAPGTSRGGTLESWTIAFRSVGAGWPTAPI
jgi:hypothetical protein